MGGKRLTPTIVEKIASKRQNGEMSARQVVAIVEISLFSRRCEMYCFKFVGSSRKLIEMISL